MAKTKVRKQGTGFLGIALACFAGGLLLKNWAGKKESLQYLDYSVGNLKLKWSGITPTVEMVVTVTNPNAAVVPVQGMFGNVFYQGNQVASFQNTSKISISGQQSSQFNLTAKLSATAIAANIINILKNPSGKSLEVRGMIQTGLFEQSFTQTIPLSI